MKYGPDYVTGVILQWQNGKQVTLWPNAAAQSKLGFPTFTHLQRR
jgi:branched-chain amino acid transport system substrate-binding protein